MIKPLTITAAMRHSLQQPCPACGAERLILKQWLTLDEYRAHQAGETVEYHTSLYCPCGWDERGGEAVKVTPMPERRQGYRSKVE